MESTLHRILEAFRISTSKDQADYAPYLPNITAFSPKRSTADRSERLARAYTPSAEKEICSKDSSKKNPRTSEIGLARNMDYQDDSGHKTADMVAGENKTHHGTAARTRKYGVFGRFYPRSFSLETDVFATRSSDGNCTSHGSSLSSESSATRRSCSLDIETRKSSLQNDGQNKSPATRSAETSGNSNFNQALENNSYELRNSKQRVYISEKHCYAGSRNQNNRISKIDHDYHYGCTNVGINGDRASAKKMGASHVSKESDKNGHRQKLNGREDQARSCVYDSAKECSKLKDCGSKHLFRKTDVEIARDHGGSALENQRSRPDEVLRFEAGSASRVIRKDTAMQIETANTHSRGSTGTTGDRKIKLVPLRSEAMDGIQTRMIKQESVDVKGYERWIAASNQYGDAFSRSGHEGNVESLLGSEGQVLEGDGRRAQEDCGFTSKKYCKSDASFAGDSFGESSGYGSTNEIVKGFQGENFGVEQTERRSHQHKTERIGSTERSYYGISAETRPVDKMRSTSQSVPIIEVSSMPSSLFAEKNEVDTPKIKLCDHILEPNPSRRGTGLQRGYSENYYVDEDVCTDDVHLVDASLCSSSYPGGREFYLLQENSSRRPLKLRRDSPFAFPLIEEFARNFKSSPMHGPNRHGFNCVHNSELSAKNIYIQEGERLRAIGPRANAMSVGRKERQ